MPSCLLEFYWINVLVYSMYSSDSGPGSPHVHARTPPPIPHVPNRLNSSCLNIFYFKRLFKMFAGFVVFINITRIVSSLFCGFYLSIC